MTKSKTQRIIAILLAVAAVALIVLGIIHMPQREAQGGRDILDALRIRTLLNATGEGVVEGYVAIAKQEASDKAREEGLGMSALREAVAKAEEEARAQHTGTSVDYDTVNTDALVPALETYTATLSAFYRAADAAEQAYLRSICPRRRRRPRPSARPSWRRARRYPRTRKSRCDMSGFVATEEMTALMVQADEAYLVVGEALKGIYPVLDDAALETLHDTIQAIVYQSGDDFTTQYDRYMDAGSGEALSNTTTAFFIRYADDLICGVALILAALALLFSRTLVVKLGIPRIIISLFSILLCLLALLYDLSLSTLLSNSVVRMGMNAIMVLAMVPGIQCGISLNLGLPIGLVAGLIGGLMTIEFGIPGWGGFLFAIAVGAAIAAVAGWLYGLLLNRLPGEEMSVTTYVGFSIVSVMCIAWLVLPFTSLELRWPLGTGLRNTIGLDSTNFDASPG